MIDYEWTRVLPEEYGFWVVQSRRTLLFFPAIFDSGTFAVPGSGRDWEPSEFLRWCKIEIPPIDISKETECK